MVWMLPLLALAAGVAQPADFVREEEMELLDFGYGWPAEADALPALRARLHADMEAERTQAMRWAGEALDNARANGIEYIEHYYAKGWGISGSTPQLLSLTATEEAFAGGAHGNITFSAILWDRAADRPVSAAEMLGAAVLRGMRERYCAALDAERAERRGETVRPDAEDPHTLCPPLAEQVLAPVDRDGDGRFDGLDVQLAPYVAGSYAEGAYVAEVPFEEQDLAGIADGYRPAFEAGDPLDPPATDD